MTTYKTLEGEKIEAEFIGSCMSTLGITLVKTEDGRVFDVEGGDAHEINSDTLLDTEESIVAWMDDLAIDNADDFTGETKLDWDWLRKSI